MNTIPTRRVPRLVDTTSEDIATERASAGLRSDLARLDADRIAAANRLDELEAGRDAVLLTDDDEKAEAHDAEMQRVRRAIERSDLKRPGVVTAIEAAVAREEADAFARKQAEASAAVEAVIGRLGKEYEAPARIIAALMVDWQAAAELAEAAKVPGPDALVRVRAPQMIAPASEDVFFVYIDEHGRETDQPYPPGIQSPDMPTRQRRARTRERPARYDDGVYLGLLSGRVNLPPARVEQDAPWSGADLMLRSDVPEPHTRRFLI